MKRIIAVGVLIASAAAYGADVAPVKIPGVSDPNRARVNWMLKCQGCHRPDASGSPATAPAMAAEVARFLQVPGGREYLVRVPGVATAALADDQLAELVNWSLWTFDPQNIPQDFVPYTASEIGDMRRRPLRTDAGAARNALLAALSARKERAEGPGRTRWSKAGN